MELAPATYRLGQELQLQGKLQRVADSARDSGGTAVPDGAAAAVPASQGKFPPHSISVVMPLSTVLKFPETQLLAAGL